MKRYELRIHDEREGVPGVLVEFSALLNGLSKSIGEILNKNWEIFRGTYGYGEKVCSIEDCLDHQESIVISGTELLSLLLSNTEYFDNARIRLQEGWIEFGVFDNTFHYVRGERHLLEDIAAQFHTTEIVEVQ